MNSKIIAVTAFVIALPVLGAVTHVQFPGAQGDIASASDWGGALPSTTDDVVFTNGTYRLSADATFGSLSVHNSRGAYVTFDFTEGNRTLKLTTIQKDSSDLQNSLFHYPYQVNDAVTTLKGGVWDFSGKELRFVDLGNNTHTSYEIDIMDGCLLTNIAPSGTSTFCNRLNGMKVRLSGASRFFTGQTKVVNGTAGNVLIDIAGGSLLNFGGAYYSEYTESGIYSPAYSVLDCHGALSSVKFGGACYLGHHGHGNVVCVRDGANLAAGTVYVNYTSYATNNWLYVQNQSTATVNKVVFRHTNSGVQVSNAVMTVGNDLYWQKDGSSFAKGNRLEVLDGANLWVKGGLYSSQPDNHILVRDATLQIDGTTSCIGGYSESLNNSFTLSGPAAKITQQSSLNLMGPSGTNNLLQIEKGATYRSPSSFVAVQGRGSTCRITGTGTLLNGRSTTGGARLLYVVNEPASGVVSPSTNCVLEVLDGATVEADRMMVHGVNTSVIVSNATINACSEEGGGTSGYALWIGRGKDAGCNLVLRGTTPTIRSPKLGTGERAMVVQGNSVIRYEIPAEGYAAGFAPIEVDALNMASTAATLEISCDDWAAETGFGKTELVLFRLTGADFNSDAKAWFAAQELNLPANVKCFIRGREIILSRKSTLGMMLILR